MVRKPTFIDNIVSNIDLAVRTLSPGAATAGRATPAERVDSEQLSQTEQKHIAALMRINHTGEVCAQALYQGQAATAKLPDVREEMEQAAAEEIDHLAWCEERINELGGQTSLLNPLFYAMSYGLGAAAGIAGDKWSLGFVAATEEQVCKHLREHLDQLPDEDEKSRAILEQMLIDEAAHGSAALQAGGQDFPLPVKQAMTLLSKAMTKTTYRL